jgi:hypothetical protein
VYGRIASPQNAAEQVVRVVRGRHSARRCPAVRVTAIAARILFDPVRDDTDYIVGAGADTRVFLGATMELLLIITNIGTAVVLFPIFKRSPGRRRSASI